MNLDELILTQAEAEAAVEKWIEEDHDSHFDALVLVIARAQIEKINKAVEQVKLEKINKAIEQVDRLQRGL